MKKTIGLSDFRKEFEDFGRSNHFSYEGLNALFDYLTNLEEDTGEEIELDVIALCCDYAEYDKEELISEYGYLVEKEEDEEDEEYLERLLEELREQTTVIEVKHDNEFSKDYGKTTYIIQAF